MTVEGKEWKARNLGYDTTRGQILLYPSFNMVKKQDPLTLFYPDCCPLDSVAIGVDYLRLGSIEELDLAYSERITRMRLVPTASSSSRERILNIIKRSWRKTHDSLKISRFGWVLEGFEHVSLCGLLYKYPTNLGDSSNKTYYPNHYAGCKKSCLKPSSLEIGDDWFALLKRSRSNSSLRQQLVDVLLYPNAASISRQERLSSDLSPVFYPTHDEDWGSETKSMRNVMGILTEDPDLPTKDMKLCVEYPGVLKRDAFSKVSFYWSVQGKPEEPESPLQDAPLKIDTVRNKNVYLIPPEIESNLSNSTSTKASPISGMLDYLSSDSILVQPIQYSEPLWHLEPAKRATSPRLMGIKEFREYSEFLVPEYSDLFDNPKSFPSFYSISKVIDSIAVQNQSIMQKGHAVFRTVSFLFELGKSLF